VAQPGVRAEVELDAVDADGVQAAEAVLEVVLRERPLVDRVAVGVRDEQALAEVGLR